MKHSYFIFLLGSCLCLLSINAQGSIDETRALLDEWVETRQLISEEQQDWRVEESILSETRTLLRNELGRLQESIQELESSATVVDEERSKLTEEKDELKDASSVIAAKIAALEAKTSKLLPLFPEPLTERLNPLIRRLPKDPENADASLGERVQNIVGILSQANKFNNTLTLTSETRKLDSGKEVQVNTLYWGLAIAYYVDASGDYAGISYPTTNGWQVSPIEGTGLQIKQLISVYEGDGAIQFVEIPAKIH
jgi:archaellum component FlaC